MKLHRKKTVTLIALFLMLTMAIPLIALPKVDAQSTRKMASYAYLIAIPNPIGVGQSTFISMWVDAALPDALYTNDIRRHGYKLTITAPDGTKTTQEWPILFDTTGVEFTKFTPTQEGKYTLLFEYAGQVFTWNASALQRQFTGTTFLPANKTVTLNVQQEPLPASLGSIPFRQNIGHVRQRDRTFTGTHYHHIGSGANYFGAFATPGGRLNLWQSDVLHPTQDT